MHTSAGGFLLLMSTILVMACGAKGSNDESRRRL
jgi:hypothetical protein